MDYRTLEITLQYAKDLSNVNLISKMDVYAVVSIAGGDKSLKQKTTSPVDHVGNTNPTWNFPMKFTVDEAALQANRLTLDFKLICERALGDKDIGVVHVPMKELLDTPPNADGKLFVSYQVRKPSGKPKGQLHFSYQFAQKIAAPPPYGAAVPFNTEPVTAYPPGSSSAYPPYPPPAAYPAAEGRDHYSPPALYPPVGGGPPPYPSAEGKDHYPPPALYPPPQSGFGGYPPPHPAGYGYPPPGYGYPPPPPPQQAKKKNKFGMGLGAGLLGGAIGGLLVGDMISDVGDFDGGFDG